MLTAVHQKFYSFLLFRGIEIPVIRFNVKYALVELTGELPHAEVYVPIGRELPFGNLSPAYSFIGAEFQEYAVLYVKATSVEVNSYFTFPQEALIPIFIGVPVNVSYEIVLGTAYYKITLAHWSFVLEQTSIVSSLTTPESVLDTKFLANISLCGFPPHPFAAMDREGASAVISTFAITNFFQTLNLWSLLGPFYYVLSNCKLDRASVAMAAAVAYANLNDPILKALNAAFTRDLNAALNSVISFLNLRGGDLLMIFGIIKDLVLNEEKNPFFIKTFLDNNNHSIMKHLVEVSRRYQFHISPLINYLALMPQNISLFSIYNITGRPFTIMNSEVLSLKKRRFLRRALRGVISYISAKSPGVTMNEQTQSIFFGGAYIGLPVGMIKTVMAPSFINLASSSALAGAPELGLADVHQALGVNWMGNRGVGGGLSRQRGVFDFRTILNEFSRLTYTIEMTLLRELSVAVGGLRLDVACGSNISIQSVADGFPVVGTVGEVSYVYNASGEGGGVYTSYSLLGVRTLDEFFDPANPNTFNPIFTSPEHYLYDSLTTPAGLPMLIV